jgi:hypothetical protein
MSVTIRPSLLVDWEMFSSILVINNLVMDTTLDSFRYQPSCEREAPYSVNGTPQREREKIG